MDEDARSRIEALEKRVAALEQRLLAGSAPAPSPSPAAPAPAAPAPAAAAAATAPATAEPAAQTIDPNIEWEIVRLLKAGKGLEAIHTYVNKTGADMATAKAEVAGIASRMTPADFA